MRILSIFLSLALALTALAQGNNPAADKTIDAKMRQEIIASVAMSVGCTMLD